MRPLHHYVAKQLADKLKLRRVVLWWAHASAVRHRWRGLALYAVDGTTLRVPDSDENREHFGRPCGCHTMG